MERRTFVKQAALVGGSLAFAPACASLKTAGKTKTGKIMTVLGEVPADELGVILIHEHLMADFIGAEEVGPHRYNREEIVEKVLPYLQELKKAGCNTLVECTPPYLGRDAEVAKTLSRKSGLHIITNTGNYAALQEKYLPRHVYDESAEQLAERWIAEWENGIGDTAVFPGIIKIGMDAGPLIPVAKKLVKAAAITHLRTGLTISAHTGDGVAALEELEILTANGVAAQAFRWVHAQKESNYELHLQAARSGAYIEFDAIRLDRIADYVQHVKKLRDEGFLHQLLISQDAGWYSVGEPDGGDFVPYTPLLTHFIPALQAEGFSDKEIDRLLVQNPKESLLIKTRRR